MLLLNTGVIFLNILPNLDFDKRCVKLTAIIGALAAVLCITAPVCRCCELPIALKQLLALLGSLSACGMLSFYAIMAVGAVEKLLPERTSLINRTADAVSESLKLFFLIMTCSGGEAIACAALIIDFLVTRFVFPQVLKMPNNANIDYTSV